MSNFDEYHELAAQLLHKEDFPLPLPNWDHDYPHNIGLLSDAEESGLAAAVLQKNPGMTYEAWKRLSLEERIPWMRLAAGIDVAGKEASPLTESAVLDSLANRLNDGVGLVEADEVESWPNGLVEKLVTDGVISPTDNALSVGCDACALDHIERVEYVESPDSSGLRAYITCPDLGRV